MLRRYLSEARDNYLAPAKARMVAFSRSYDATYSPRVSHRRGSQAPSTAPSSNWMLTGQ